jgi:hypothetical protein
LDILETNLFPAMKEAHENIMLRLLEYKIKFHNNVARLREIRKEKLILRNKELEGINNIKNLTLSILL